MKLLINIGIKFFLAALLLFKLELYAQEFEIRDNSWFLPNESTPGSVNHLIGLSLAKIPEEIIESEEVFRSPLFYYRIKVGVPLNFVVNASLESNIITYHADAGFSWNLIIDKFSFAPGFNFSYWIGTLKQEGFDSKISGTNFFPGLNIGYSFGKFGITLSGELLYQVNATIKNGDVLISRELRKFNGTALGIFLEQPLWKDNVVTLGFRSLFIKSYYPAWAAFPSFDRRFHVTEIVAGLIL